MLLAASLSACTSVTAPPAAEQSPDVADQADGPVLALDVPDVARGIRRLLTQRAAAVRAGDRTAYDALLDPGSPAFVQGQEQLLATLAQLPLAEFSYSWDQGSLVRDGEEYRVMVERRMRLEGYDAAPVVTRHRFRFAPDAAGRLRLSAVTDPRWEQTRTRPVPDWEAGPLQVRTVPGVLGVFDETTVGRAGALLAAVSRGVDAVAGVVPEPWSRTVVVYALSDPASLTGLDDLPASSDPATLDAVTVAVPASPDGGRVAAYRIVLNPRVLSLAADSRDRLLRHELTHVALGPATDGAPTWLAEGLAEWVSVQALPAQLRRVPSAAVTAARARSGVLPDAATFRAGDVATSYARSWWACEAIARREGVAVLWGLLDAFDPDRPGGPLTLREALGEGERALADRTDRLLVQTYAPTGSSG